MGLNQSNISDLFESKTSEVSGKLSEYKNQRDELNVLVRGQLDRRNEINRQVKELIIEVQKQKAIRNEANGKVADLRKIRLERTNELKEVRSKLRDLSKNDTKSEGRKKNGKSSRSLREQMNKLEWRHQTGQISPKKEKDFFSTMKRLQGEYKVLKAKEESSSSSVLKEVKHAEKVQKAHDAVTAASEKSEEAHSLMMELSNEVDRLRGLANKEHLKLTSTKNDADEKHNRYIISLRCIHSMQDILKLSGSKKDADEEDRVDVTDLMSKLMSGDTLSTDELMMLQRN